MAPRAACERAALRQPLAQDPGDWNPLRRTGAAAKLLAFLAPDPSLWANDQARLSWTAEELNTWLDAIKIKDVLKRGAKKIIEAEAEIPEGGEVSQLQLREWFRPEALARAQTLDTRWLQAHLKADAAAGFEFPLEVCRQRSAALLRQHPPKITIGTVHSVKGGESQIVILAPDLSVAAYRSMHESDARRDAVARTFYVAATRASEEGYLLQPETPCRVEWGV